MSSIRFRLRLPWGPSCQEHPVVLPLPTLRRLRGPRNPFMLPVAAWLPSERARCLSAAGSRDPTAPWVPEGTARSQALWQ